MSEERQAGLERKALEVGERRKTKVRWRSYVKKARVCGWERTERWRRQPEVHDSFETVLMPPNTPLESRCVVRGMREVRVHSGLGGTTHILGLYMTPPRPHTVTQTFSACVNASKDDPASETASIALVFLEWGFVSGESRDRRLCVLPKGGVRVRFTQVAREGAGAVSCHSCDNLPCTL